MIKLLYFFPENPALLNQGNNSRANFLLNYFNSKSYSVDLVGEYEQKFTEKDIDTLKQLKLVNNAWLLKKDVKNFTHFITDVLPDKLYKGILKIISPNAYKKNYDLNKLKKGYLQTFETILKSKQYDIVIISYTSWSPLIKNISNISPNTKIIIDTHDFITAQYQSKPHFDIGYYFKKEIESLKLFDEIWAISIEEQFIFSQFIESNKVKLVPHGTKINTQKKSNAFNIDLLYVASDNPHNIKSALWFLNEVLPLLPENLKITFVGKICKQVPDSHRIEKINFVEDLNTLYLSSKVSLCPMLSGTGLKIKVVEALSYGLPIVCNPRGVDGLLNKIDNGCLVAETPTDFANNIIKLLSDTDFYSIIRKQGLDFFNKTLSEQVVYKTLDNLFKEV